MQRRWQNVANDSDAPSMSVLSVHAWTPLPAFAQPAAAWSRASSIGSCAKGERQTAQRATDERGLQRNRATSLSHCSRPRSHSSGASSTYTLASVIEIAPTVANRLAVIETGTDTSLRAVRSAPITSPGSLINVPRVSGVLATTHVVLPAAVRNREFDAVPSCL